MGMMTTMLRTPPNATRPPSLSGRVLWGLTYRILMRLFGI